MDERAPVFFFAPFVSSTMPVHPDWVDRSGHLTMAYYHVFFDRAVEEAFGLAGLGQEDGEERSSACFVAETHTLFKRELTARDVTRVTLQLIDFDDKRLHFYMEARHATHGWLSATTEAMCLHVDTQSRAVTPFPDSVQANLAIMKAAHSRLAKPKALGRIMGIPERSDPHGSLVAAGMHH